MPDLVRNNPSTNVTNNTIAKDFGGLQSDVMLRACTGVLHGK